MFFRASSFLLLPLCLSTVCLSATPEEGLPTHLPAICESELAPGLESLKLKNPHSASAEMLKSALDQTLAYDFSNSLRDMAVRADMDFLYLAYRVAGLSHEAIREKAEPLLRAYMNRGELGEKHKLHHDFKVVARLGEEIDRLQQQISRDPQSPVLTPALLKLVGDEMKSMAIPVWGDARFTLELAPYIYRFHHAFATAQILGLQDMSDLSLQNHVRIPRQSPLDFESTLEKLHPGREQMIYGLIMLERALVLKKFPQIDAANSAAEALRGVKGPYRPLARALLAEFLEKELSKLSPDQINQLSFGNFERGGTYLVALGSLYDPKLSRDERINRFARESVERLTAVPLAHWQNYLEAEPQLGDFDPDDTKRRDLYFISWALAETKNFERLVQAGRAIYTGRTSRDKKVAAAAYEYAFIFFHRGRAAQERTEVLYEELRHGNVLADPVAMVRWAEARSKYYDDVEVLEALTHDFKNAWFQADTPAVKDALKQAANAFERRSHYLSVQAAAREPAPSADRDYRLREAFNFRRAQMNFFRSSLLESRQLWIDGQEPFTSESRDDLISLADEELEEGHLEKAFKMYKAAFHVEGMREVARAILEGLPKTLPDGPKPVFHALMTLLSTAWAEEIESAPPPPRVAPFSPN